VFMSEWFKVVLLGIVEGITEFFPISSTGHLIIFGDLLEFKGDFAVTFSIAIQLGAISAIVVLYWDYFKQFLDPRRWLSDDMRKIIVAIFPALLLGFILHSFIKTLFSSTIVYVALIVGGIIMLLTQILIKQEQRNMVTSLNDVSYKQALIVGVFQCFSLCPGVSRSGSTIVGGVLGGLSYAIAAEFSFIISVPVMTAAVSYELVTSASALSLENLAMIMVGFAVSFVVAAFSVVTLLKILKRFQFLPFAIYRIILGSAGLMI